ncbi:MAG: plasmid mobilization protein [Gemmatimonadaceae bacterium]
MSGTTHERRNCPKLVRFSPTELAVVVDRARASGRPVACYIRESALGAKPRARHAALNDAAVTELAKFATRLGNLARLAAERQSPEAATCAALADAALDLIRRID